MRLERKITDRDKALLASYDAKCQEVSSFTLACLAGTQTGMMLFGAGGTGKSYSIQETLAERKIREILPEDILAVEAAKDRDGDEVSPLPEYGYDTWLHHQGRITAKGLIRSIAPFRKSLHLVEDAEPLLDDPNTWGILRSGLDSQDHSPHPKRRMQWGLGKAKDSYDFYFTGSIILVGNRLLKDNNEEIKAVKTRLPCLNFDVTNDEIIAKMKQLCEPGYKHIHALSKDECYTVLEFILTAIEDDPALKRDSRGKEKKLNLRILIAGFRYMAFGKTEKTISWQNMLLSQLKEQVGASLRKQKDRIRDEAAIASELVSKNLPTQHDKLLEWCRLTERDMKWADCPRDSAEYLRGFRSSKTDFSRKLNS